MVAKCMTYRLLEAIVPQEYQGLSDIHKDYVRMIVSCGVIDLADGTTVREALNSMFGEESQTHENLEQLEYDTINWMPPGELPEG